MRKIYIWGAGRLGIKCKERLSQYDIKLHGFIDTYKSGEVEDFAIVNDIKKIDSNDLVVISLQFQETVVDIYQMIRSNNVGCKIFWWHEATYYSQQEDFFIGECTEITNWGDIIFPHIEYHIVDYCNLNCRGCTHFSPLFSDTKETYQEKIRNIKIMLTKFDDIARLDILGGEPLMSENLIDYITSLRKLLPNTWLRIFTNGLLLPQLDENCLNTISRNHVSVYVSEYSPTHKMLGKIIETLQKYNITYILSGFDNRAKFNLPLTTTENTKYNNCCISNGCYAVGDHKIAKCPTLLYINKFNEYFDENLPDEGLIDIGSDLTGEEILEKLKQPVPLCKFCIENSIDWKVCGLSPKFSDFAVRD